MTFAKFCSASRFVQKTVILFHGVLLMTRKAKDLQAELYQVDGFYVEFFYRNNSSDLLDVKCYADPAGINAYLKRVDLSEIEFLLK